MKADKNLYRGKPLKGPAWVFGAYYEHEPPLIAIGKQTEKPKPHILRTGFADWNMPRQIEVVPVQEGSVGQFTGLYASRSYRGTQKEDLMIFEKDIIEHDGGTYLNLQAWRAAVIWREDMAAFFVSCRDNLGYYNMDNITIIGNTFENIELLGHEHYI